MKANEMYLNGDSNSELSIKRNSKLYNFLERNYYTIVEDGIEKLVVDEETLEDLLNCDDEFSEEENVLIGKLIYHLEYCGGYLFY